jgi:hypothetical protein
MKKIKLLFLAMLGSINIISFANAHQLDVNNKTPYKVYVSIGTKSANIIAGTLESLDIFETTNVPINVSTNEQGINPGSCNLDASKIKVNNRTKITISTSIRSALIGRKTLKCAHTAIEFSIF